MTKSVVEPVDAQTFFDRFARWIEWESAAEAQRLTERRKRIGKSDSDAERSGETIVDLVVEDSESGLGGRYLLTLVKRNRTLPLPWTRLKVGSPVILSSVDESEEPCSAIVCGRTPRSLQVALEEWPDGERFRVDLAPDEVTRKRQLAALKAALVARGRTGQLRQMLLGHRLPQFHAGSPCSFPSGLNPTQQAAVDFAMTADDLAIIHGPPGTGKTTTIVELICQSVMRGEKVLACAPSNTAVDNLVERLVRARQHVVRLGHPARVSAELRAHSLDVLVESHHNMKIVKRLMRDIQGAYHRADRFSRARPTPGMRGSLRNEARQMKAEIRRLELQAVEHTLDRADVICATTTLDDDLLGERKFDLLVIDEACQSTEPGCWIPLLRAQRVVLAGDPFQLPPTIVSTAAAQEGFSCSLLERMMKMHGDTITRRLGVQYRMHEQIMEFSSREFYQSSLVADDSVRTHLLHHLPDIVDNMITNQAITFVDSAGAGWDEELEPEGESRRNIQEGAHVLEIVQQLVDAGLVASDIAVIAPYAAQVRWLRSNSSHPDLEIDTVDGFQGREKEAVVISLVRSNREGEIGFLADTRRMNVALTRARRKLIVVGDSATLGGNPFYADLLSYFEQLGGYRTVWG
ncbi:MAG: AAA domain-containing protein [Planctomycetota bacterium]|nr:AAA domain-containing protein [Planctomycetota bacterium]MDA1179671.1 AAA domain-containing protein [Planctomycetota bacterium]